MISAILYSMLLVTLVSSFRPNWVGSGVLFNFSTTTFKQTYDYVGEGTLFGFSSTEERVVWDYNNSSIDYFTYENFGSVAESPIESITIQSIANETIQSRANERIIDLVVAGSTSGAFLDFGTILTDGEQTPSTVGLDWGHILTNQTDYPFGLFPISGTAKQVFTPNFVGSGGLFAFVNGRGRTKPRWIAFVNIGIFGASKTNFSLLHEGSGSLFSINNADDSRAYAYRGSGALYAFSGAAEAVGFNPPEDTAILPLQGAAGVAFAPNWIAEGTVKTEGAAVERQTDHYKGSGTLFNFETALEKITYHYSSTSNDIFQYRNYGSVADQPIESITIQSIANETIESRKDDRIIDLVVGGSTSGSYLDYGPILIDGEDAPETVREDYGSIMESISRYAMGDLLVHGTAAVRREFSYVGKGDLFAFIEGRGRTKPRWIANVNIEVSGEGQDAVVKRFIGDGNLFNFEKAEEKKNLWLRRSRNLLHIWRKLLLHTRKHHIVHLSSSMLLATRELHSYQTSMVLVLPPSMSGMSKELHSARLDLVSSSTWATLSREERITTVILPTLYSLLWIMVRLVSIQSTPSRSNLSLMIRLKVVRTRELLIL